MGHVVAARRAWRRGGGSAGSGDRVRRGRRHADACPACTVSWCAPAVPSAVPPLVVSGLCVAAGAGAWLLGGPTAVCVGGSCTGGQRWPSPVRTSSEPAVWRAARSVITDVTAGRAEPPATTEKRVCGPSAVVSLCLWVLPAADPAARAVAWCRLPCPWAQRQCPEGAHGRGRRRRGGRGGATKCHTRWPGGCATIGG